MVVVTESHPETCGPCEECKAYLDAKGFTLESYIGGRDVWAELHAMGYEIVKTDRSSAVDAGRRRRKARAESRAWEPF
jgi:hypothetical protein